jgi:hypothetical protein
MLSQDDQERAKYHLGYLGTTLGASIALGIPAAIPTDFITEHALTLIRSFDNTFWEPKIISILDAMDTIEAQMLQALPRLSAKVAGSVTLNLNETDFLEGEYRRWGYRLADILGTPVNPYSPRYSAGGICVARI